MGGSAPSGEGTFERGGKERNSSSPQGGELLAGGRWKLLSTRKGERITTTTEEGG